MDIPDNIGYCGVDCSGCPDFRQGKCADCRNTVWTDGDICPPVACCRRRSISCCGECGEFPCRMMLGFYEESDSHRLAGQLMRKIAENK